MPKPCIHYWILGDAKDGEVPGRCKRCRTKKSFPAHTDYDFNLKTAPYGELRIDRERDEYRLAEERVA